MTYVPFPFSLEEGEGTGTVEFVAIVFFSPGQTLFIGEGF